MVEHEGAAAVRRSSRRERRRDQVYQEAIRLFVEQGFDSTTMEQIADGADVARATVFNYFPRKAAFLDEWTSRRRSRASATLANADLSEWPVKRVLGEYISGLAQISVQSRAETVALMTAIVQGTNLLAHSPLADELAKYIAIAQKQGEVLRNRDATQVGALVAAVYYSVLSQWISEEPVGFDLERRLLDVLDIVLEGIVATERAVAIVPRQRAPRQARTAAPRAKNS